jgi:sulfur-oxidizing protein SoxA
MIRAALALLLSALPALAEGIPAGQRQSGFATMRPDTQEMQLNDRQNPAMLLVAEGERLWNLPAGEGLRSCAGCHGDAAKEMAGTAARYPVFDTASGKPRDLTAQIRFCRSENQRAPEWAYESRPLLAMASYIGLQSRGVPIKPPTDLRLDVFERAGRALFSQRIGQLNLSCAGCHDENWGRRLGGSLIPQGHPTGYPIYRLEWQATGSLQRRLRNCMTGVRAEPYPYGAEEMVALELYLKRRAEGMPVETPAVRP